jgi:sodium-dependent dicarboxylate transporter 2/3/5
MHLLRLAAGPIAFALALLLPLALPYEGRVAIGTFVWAVVWWILQPVPWAIAAILPLVVFPAAGVMTVTATAALYGHPIFFWIMGTVLIGYAIEKHGVARRFALAFLALPTVAGQTRRLTFAYMLVVGIISMFVSDAATIAMMIPIGMSIVRHIRTMAPGAPAAANFGAFMALGTFYAAVAGGTGTMVGIPHNAIAVSLVESLAGRAVGWFDWMTVGVPVFLTLLAGFYILLWIFVPPEIRQVPGGEAFLRAERAKLGTMTANEWRVLFVFAMMVLLFTLPTIVALTFGEGHPATENVERALSIWVVPPAVLLLLFTIPAKGTKGGLLTWKEAEQQSPWNVMILVLGAVAMAEALTKFGFVDLMGGMVRDLGLSRTALPYVASMLTAVTTNFISGTAATALYCSIFIPAAVNTGFNPASIAILIANVALGIALPWAGAAAATAFAVGELDMRLMIKVGSIATVLFALTVATVHLLLAPFV